MQMTKNKMKNVVLFFGICLLLAFCPMLYAKAANTANTRELILIYASYSGDSLMVGEKIELDKLTVTAMYSDGTTEDIEDYAISTEKVSVIGANVVTVTYQGKSNSFNVYGKELTSIYASYIGSRISVGNKVGKQDVTVWAFYTDGTMKQVKDYTLVNDEINTVGEQKITVLYKGISTTFRVQGIAARPVYQLKVVYYGVGVIEGNPVPAEDLYVTAVYSDGTTERIHNYNLSPGVLENLGTNEVTVLYKGRQTTIQVECIARTLMHVTAEYEGGVVEIGRSVDRNKLLVKAHYNDGSSEVIEDYTLMPAKVLVRGNNTVTVLYNNMKTTFKVIGVEHVEEDYSHASSFKITNGKKKASVQVALPSGMQTNGLTGRSLKLDRVRKVLGKIKAQDSEYIAFDILLTDEAQDDIFPLTMRITPPSSFKLEYTNLYYTSNRKTVIAKMNVERQLTGQMELTIYHPGTYILVYQEPEETEEDKKKEEDSDYLD